MTAERQADKMQTECWKRGKITLTAVREVANPFLDVDITAVFTGPNGEKILLPGYWDGGQTFCVRFAPTAVGQWNYEIHANPDDPGLTQSGEIVCVPYTGELPLIGTALCAPAPRGVIGPTPTARHSSGWAVPTGPL